MRVRWRLVTGMLAAGLLSGGCSLTGMFDEPPSEGCDPGDTRTRVDSCGVCGTGTAAQECSPEGVWETVSCDDSVDADGDGVPNATGGVGSAFVYDGTAGGVPTAPSATLTEPTLNPDAYFGGAVAWLGPALLPEGRSIGLLALRFAPFPICRPDPEPFDPWSLLRSFLAS